jgi:hypothetical protein
MQRHLTGLAELAVTDRQQAIDRIKIAAIEADGLANPHAAHRQQGDQRPIRRHPVRRAQAAGCRHQGGNVRVRVEIGRGTTALPRQQIPRRHLRRRVDALQVNGKATNDRQPGRCPTSMRARRDGRPGHCRGSGQVLFATNLDVGEELSQQFLGPNQPVAKNAPHGQVVGQGLAEGAHAPSPGQGRAIVRSRSRSTLA